MTLKHSYNSTIAEDPASGTPGGLVGPNEWNADHAVSGTSLQTLFNNAGSLTGMSGTSWDNTNLALTITGATVTTSNPILNLSQTWNAGGVTFTGLKLNVTNTASASASKIFDFQVAGSSVLSLISSVPQLAFSGVTSTTPSFRWPTAQLLEVVLGDISDWADFTARTIKSSSGQIFVASDIDLAREAAGTLMVTQGVTGAHATGLHVYNNADAVSGANTNYERGVFDWTTAANVLTIGVQKGGTGSTRALQFSTSNSQVNFGSFASYSDPSGFIVLAGGNGGAVGWSSIATFANLSTQGTVDVGLSREAARILQVTDLAGGANAVGFHVYNTTDSVAGAPTNYERGAFDWTTTSNVLTIGTQAGGTGTLRAVQFVGADFVHGASVATNATDGFLYIPSCAGTPTGTPTTFTGTVPMVYDRTNNKFYIYNGGWKGGTNPGAFT